jgi:hypothetical protein
MSSKCSFPLMRFSYSALTHSSLPCVLHIFPSGLLCFRVSAVCVRVRARVRACPYSGGPNTAYSYKLRPLTHQNQISIIEVLRTSVNTVMMSVKHVSSVQTFSITYCFSWLPAMM